MLAKSINIFSILVMAVLFFSCEKKQEHLSSRQYISFVEKRDNGFIKEKKIGNLKFALRYEPTDYTASIHIEKGSIKNQQQLVEFRKKREGLNCFVLEVENMRAETDVLMEGIHDQASYLQRVNYYSFDFERDLYFVSANDTLSCALFHYENSYGGTPKLKFLVSFDSKNIDEGTFIINDRIFNMGTIKFDVEKEILSNNPVLDF